MVIWCVMFLLCPFSNLLHFRFVPSIKCPLCSAAGIESKVTCEGWNTNGPRRVFGTHGHYYIWARRHKCHSNGFPHPDGRTVTFQGYDPEVMKQLPSFISRQFPCVLTRRAAIDKESEALIVSLFQNSMGAQTIASLLQELNAYRYYHDTSVCIDYIRAWNDRCLSLQRSRNNTVSGHGNITTCSVDRLTSYPFVYCITVILLSYTGSCQVIRSSLT